MRTSYYQNIGNPIQLARLPKRRLELTFPIRDLSASRKTKVAFIGCGFLLLAILLESAAKAYLLGNDSGKPGHGIVLIGGIALAITLCTTLRSGRWISIVGISLSILSLGIAISVFSAFSLLPVMIAIGWHVRIYCEHWIELCTSSPVPKHQSRQLRKQWRRYLICIQWLPAGLLFLMFLSGLPVVFVIVVVCVFAAVQTVHVSVASGTGYAFRALWSSVESWFSYNYHNIARPGTFQSPAGSRRSRILLSVFMGLFVATMFRIAHSELSIQSSSLAVEFSILNCIVGTLFTILIPGMLTLPVIAEAMEFSSGSVGSKNWNDMTREMRLSTNPIERNSYFMGRVVNDGSPLIVPRSIFREHAHFLGDSGSGKTSLGLAPFLEQTIAFGDCSIVVIDLKADSKELLATVMQAVRKYRYQTGFEIPIKFFNNQDDMASFGLNIFNQSFWPLLNTYTRTDVIAGATGLEYGAGFGESFYSATNAAVLYHTLKLYPEVQSFSELADRCGYVVANAKKRDLHPEVRKAGVHVHEVCKRLGAFPQLNVTADGPFDDQVVQQLIDLCAVFREPQILYFELSSLLSPGSSPAIARLVVYFLLAAATKTDRQCPVFLVIDEFQRMVAKNVEYMLQLARSMDIGITLANQSMEDLRTGRIDLISPLESNCRYRQWFSTSSSADRSRLVDSSGETVELVTSKSVSPGIVPLLKSISYAEHIHPRLTTNDVLLASDHSKESVVKISRGDGYAQFGGMPLIVESDYHISRDEYDVRRSLKWPQNIPGTFVPSRLSESDVPGPDIGPIITTDAGLRSDIGASDLDDILDSFGREATSRESRRRSKRGRRE